MSYSPKQKLFIQDPAFAQFEQLNEIADELRKMSGSSELKAEVDHLKRIIADLQAKADIPDNEALAGFKKLFASIKGPPGPKGDPGETPSEKQLLALIKPLIPDPVPGEMGPKPEAGVDYEIPLDGEPGRNGQDGKPGAKGDPGPIPDHEWSGTKLRFEKPDGNWGQWVDLQGAKGEQGTGKILGGVGGGRGINFADEEIPSGTINSVNTIFTLNYPPVSGSLKVILNGVRQKLKTSSVNGDYTLSSNTITFVTAPQSESTLICDYRY